MTLQFSLKHKHNKIFKMNNKEAIEYVGAVTKNLNFGIIKGIKKIENKFCPEKQRLLVSTQKGNYLFKFDHQINYENIDFLKYLNSENFPSQKIYLVMEETPFLGVVCSVYGFLDGKIKNSLSINETAKVAGLIAKLHNKSDYYLGNGLGEGGLTHGDLKLQNILFVKGDPYLIDFERMKIRPYLTDVTGYLFYNTLSGLTKNLLSFQEAKKNANLFLNTYSQQRGVLIRKDSFEKNIELHSNWFNSWKKESPNLKRRRAFVNKSLEILLNLDSEE